MLVNGLYFPAIILCLLCGRALADSACSHDASCEVDESSLLQLRLNEVSGSGWEHGQHDMQKIKLRHAMQKSVAAAGGQLAASLCGDVPLCGCSPLYEFASHQAPPYDRVAEDEYCRADTATMCAASSFPVQSLFASGSIPYISREEAKRVLEGKKVLFIGDSTNRRLMFGLCSFIEQQPYTDRFDVPLYHHTLQCPDKRFLRQYPDDTLRGIGSLLEIRWAQTWFQAKEVLEQIAKAGEHWDHIMLGFFIHGIADNKYHLRDNVTEDAAAVLEGYRNIFGSTALMEALPPISVFTPNLVHGTQEATRLMNTAIKQASQSLLQMKLPSRVSMVDGTSWMAAGETEQESQQRHECLGNHIPPSAPVLDMQKRDDPLWSIHLETTYGAMLQTQQLLQVMRKNL
eukprot:gnl/TRDRNA2_/TRDRNA2_187412_c0_seq1.p1 gnl/TRDRNA2_/TRDRNA2_187412_c0~~gnl/TRDRNA2_/TRDRNA2_187412_c0_seq1.p1  ORF type:complete len:401 (-),score=72.68 gnl/TRDRNA2_/TRDRNA2_187412_c0_seq1:53-1255(-)